MTTGDEKRTGAGRTIGVAAGLLGLSLIWVFVIVPRWGRLPLVRSVEPGQAAVLEREPPVPVARVAAVRGTRLAVRDGLVRDGALVVATTTELVVLGADGAADHVRSWTRPEGAAITAIAPWIDGGVVVGASDGSVTFVGESSAELVRVTGAGPVVDLALSGSRLVVATSGGGLVTIERDRARRVDVLSDGTRLAELSALAAEARVALGSVDGVVVAERDGRLERWTQVDGRVTALAWQAGRLLVGTGGGVVRVAPNGARETLARNLDVTAVLASPTGDVIWVGTPDGVVVLGPGSERRLLAGERIERLRLVGGRPLAFGTHGVWDLDSGDAIVIGS